MNDRETKRADPQASKWRKLKASLFGRNTEIGKEELTPTPAPQIAPLPEPETAPAPRTEEKKDGGKKKGRSGSAKRQRERGFMVRATDDEFNVIRERAASAGLSAGAFLRACALGDKGPRARRALPLNSALLIEALASLNRIGNNLNQIAHQMNAGGHPASAAIADSRAELSATLQNILEALGRSE